MDGCDLMDDISLNDGEVIATNCGCGVRSNGLSFQGTFDYATFDENLNEVFKSDWSMSMYIQVENGGTDPVDIMYIGSQCSIDSVFSLRYLPSTARFRFLLSSSPNIRVELDGLTDNNSCWQHVVITKSSSNVFLYINGSLADQGAAVSDIVLNVPGPLTISNSPCQRISNNPDVKFRGVIDELTFFNGSLSALDIQSISLSPDKIITSDTTIFVGESILIKTGGSCSEDFQWSPSSFLNDPNSLNPIASPLEDITYTLTINGNNGCSSVDNVTIRVADPSVLTCSDLLLPSAFTPNGDMINDTYGISNAFLISQLSSFEIFNKWGGRVFSTNDLSQTWNGIHQGAPSPPDSYVYKVRYVCENQLYMTSGTLTLIR